MKKKNIEISVIVTTFNSNLKFLSECLNSIVAQSYKNFEIILVDDFSNKKIYQIQKKYIKQEFKKKEIRLLRNSKNYGVSYSLNRGIKVSKGKYINWCSYDDYFHIDKLKKQHQKIKNLNGVVISCNTFVKYENYNIFLRQNYNYLKNNHALLFKDKFSGGSFLIPKSFFYKFGFFNEKLRYVQDYDVWLRWSDHNIKFKNVNDYLFYMRIHTKQDTQLNYVHIEKEKKIFYFNYFKNNIDYFLNFYPISKIFFLVIYFQYRNLQNVVKFIVHKIYKNYLSNQGYYYFYTVKFVINTLLKLISLNRYLVKYSRNLILKIFSNFLKMKKII
jgi:glycosyltransferase involved in cell wall biosynthesis